MGPLPEIADSISGLPLVVLSASPDVADKVLLLEMGADDYLTIPFSPRELVARVRALMRRASRISPESLYVFEDVIVDFSKTEITRGGEKVRSLQRNSRRWSSWQRTPSAWSRETNFSMKCGVTRTTPVLERWTTTS